MASKDEAFADLDISQNLQESLAMLGEQDIERFFESLKVRKLRKVEVAKGAKALTAIQNSVKMATEIKNLFLSLRQAVRTTQAT